MTGDSRYRAYSGAVGDGEGLDAVDPAGAEADRVAGLGDVRHGVGDGGEDELDLQLGQAGAQAVVRAEAAVAQVRVRVAADVEPPGLVEDLLVEVGRPVEQAQPVARLDLLAAELGVLGGGALEHGD